MRAVAPRWFHPHRASPLTGLHPSQGFTPHRASPCTGLHPAQGFHPVLRYVALSGLGVVLDRRGCVAHRASPCTGFPPCVNVCRPFRAGSGFR